MKNSKHSRKGFSKKLLGISLTAAMVLTAAAGMGAVVGATDGPDSQSYGLADTIQEGTILHCFDWKYQDIEAELPNIAKAGFTSVQTSPAQGGSNSGVWYWLYQPLGFSVKTSDLGTKEELASLCAKAQEYGISVIVDVVANHLAGNNREMLDQPFAEDEYWHNGRPEIIYRNRDSITHDNLGAYGDLNSENSVVQQAAADYVNELAALGVDGIRWDAAKHIGLPSEDCAFWSAVTSGNSLYHYGEILDTPVSGAAGDELMKEYTQYMSVTDNGYGNGMMSNFKNGKAPTADGNWVTKGISADKLVYWGESHDTYANKKNQGSNGVDQNIIDRAYAVAAARKDATALYLSRPNNSIPDQMMAGKKGSMHFTAPEIAAVNHFHNKAGNAADAYAVEDNVAVVTREGVGAVLVLGSGADTEISIKNTYNNIPTGTLVDEVTGNTFTVTSETISGKVGSSGIAVIYNSDFASRVEASPLSDTEFEDTLDVTLRAIGVTDAKYYLSYSNEVGNFKDGDVITIGGDMVPGGSTVTLTLKANKADGSEVSAEYTYTKLAKKNLPKLTKGGVIFDNDVEKWSKINVYVYDERTTVGQTVTNGEWPGVPMTAANDNLYTYEFPEEFKDCKNIMVIFNNGSGGQIPAKDGFLNDYDKVGYYDGGETLKIVQDPSAPEEPEKEASPYSIIGSMTDWKSDIPMYDQGEGKFAGSFTVDAGTYEFKVRKDADWLLSWGVYEPDYDRTQNSQTNVKVTVENKTTINVLLDTSGSDIELWPVIISYPAGGDDSEMPSMVYVNTGKPDEQESSEPSMDSKPSKDPDVSKVSLAASTPALQSFVAPSQQPSVNPSVAPIQTSDSTPVMTIVIVALGAAAAAFAVLMGKKKHE